MSDMNMPGTIRWVTGTPESPLWVTTKITDTSAAQAASDGRDTQKMRSEALQAALRTPGVNGDAAVGRAAERYYAFLIGAEPAGSAAPEPPKIW